MINEAAKLSKQLKDHIQLLKQTKSIMHGEEQPQSEFYAKFALVHQHPKWTSPGNRIRSTYK